MKKIAKIIFIIILCFVGFTCKKNSDNPTTPTNSAPTTPSNPTPADGAVNISRSPILNWVSSDPEGDVITYELYLSYVNPPNTLIAGNLTTSSYAITGLDSNKTYYWRINAKDSKGSASSGPIWRFTTIANSLPAQGLVLYFPFSGNANDASGNANNGTVHGPILSPDRFNQSDKAYSFNGLNNYIEVQNSAKLNFNASTDFTFITWIKFSSQNVPTSYFVPIFYKRCDSPLPPIGYGLGVIYNKGAAEMHTSTGTLGGDNGLIGTSSINDNQWHMLVLAVSRGNTDAKIYVDNILETDLNNGILGMTVDNVSSLFIGTTNWGASSDRFFKGLIDDIRIFNRTLTESEIQQLYHEGGWTK
ncbi:MAG: LamG domain-containing protein [Bacteroidota bacterium]